MRYLGIDPGLRITGYACIETGERDAIALVEAGAFRLDARRPIVERLVELEEDLVSALERLNPHVGVVERLFSHYRHPTTAITMGHARGVIFLAMGRRELPLVELAPTEIKKSLTGNGHAGKAQMQAAVRAQLSLATTPDPPDVADAIAIALCAARRAGQETSTRS